MNQKMGQFLVKLSQYDELRTISLDLVIQRGNVMFVSIVVLFISLRQLIGSVFCLLHAVQHGMEAQFNYLQP